MQIGQFTLIEKIGHGGTSRVWRGEHVIQKTPVAIKVMNEAWIKQQGTAAFQHEVQTMARLNHPGIVRIFDSNIVSKEAEKQSNGVLKAGAPCVMMEFAEHGTLHSLKRELDWEGLQFVIHSILDSLSHAHARKLLHSDLKPGNILVTKHDNRTQIKLADFGLAYALNRAIDSSKVLTTSGTPRYMSPEQAKGRPRDFGPWTDLYALGCVLYRIISGQPPYSGEVEYVLKAHVFDDLPDLKSDFELPAWFMDWMRTLMAKDWSKRFRCAADAMYTFNLFSERTASKISFPLSTEDQNNWDEPTILDTSTIVMPITNDDVPTGEWSPVVNALAGTIATFPKHWASTQNERLSAKIIGTGLALFGVRDIPFVGREKERDRLWQTLEEVHRTQTYRSQSIVAAKGAGKSSLGTWFARRADETGSARSLLIKHNYPPGPNDGLVAAIKTHLRCDNLSERKIRGRIEGLFKRTGGLNEQDLFDCRALASALASADRGLDEESEEKIQFQSRRELFVTLKRVMSRMTLWRPLIVIIDDAQWADEALGFAEYLKEEGDIPIMVLATIREEEKANKPELEGLIDDEIQLSVLNAAEHHRLVEELLPLEANLVSAIAKRTAGNPLFAVQLIEDWVQRGIFEFSNDGFILQSGSELRLPESIHQVWTARFEKLSQIFPSATSLLFVGAILGLEVDQSEWTSICKRLGFEIADGLLAYLTSSRLVSVSDRGWTFTHAMLREAILENGSPTQTANEVNLTVATFLNELKNDSPNHKLRIAHHFIEANVLEKSLPAYTSAALEFIVQGEYRDALNTIDKYEDILRRLDTPKTDPLWGKLLSQKIWARYELSDPIEHDLADCVTQARQPGWEEVLPQLILRYAGDLTRRGQFETAMAEIRDVLTMDLTPKDRFDCFAALSVPAFYLNQLEQSVNYLKDAEDLLPKIEENLKFERRLATMITFPLIKMNKLALAEKYGRRAIELSVALGSKYAEGRSWTQIASIAMSMGKVEAAIDASKKSIFLLKAIGAWRVCYAQIGLAQIYLLQGEYKLALTEFEEMNNSKVKDVFNDRLQLRNRLGKAVAHAGLGAWSEFNSYLSEARRRISNAESIEHEIITLLNYGTKICHENNKNEELIELYRIKIKSYQLLKLSKEVEETKKILSALAKNVT